MNKKTKSLNNSSHKTELDESIGRLIATGIKALAKRGTTQPKTPGKDIVPSPSRNTDKYTGPIDGGRLKSSNPPTGGTSNRPTGNRSGVPTAMKVPSGPEISEPTERPSPKLPKPSTEPESEVRYTYLPKSGQMVPVGGGDPINVDGENTIRAGSGRDFKQYVLRQSPDGKLKTFVPRGNPTVPRGNPTAIDTVPMRESAVDIIRGTIDENPLDVQNTVSDLMLNKIRDAVDLKKIEMAQQFFDAVPEDGWDNEEDEETYDDSDEEEFDDEEEEYDDDEGDFEDEEEFDDDYEAEEDEENQ